MSNDPIENAVKWLEQGHKVAIATVVKTWGSAPRKAGSQLAIRDDGLMVGSVSGGCVEGDVVENALEIINKPNSVKLLQYGITNDTAWEVGLACGGDIKIRIDSIQNDG
tara:strand:- start:1225 stop:1551 length:327 start_codon:yes stop_codon:yes gene_type:complete